MKQDRIDADQLWDYAWTYIRTVVDTVREPFLIMDKSLRVISANRTFYASFETEPKDTEGKPVYKLGNGQWNIPKLKILLEDILPKNTYFEDFRVEHDFPVVGRKIMMLNARRVYVDGDVRQIIMLAMEDITKETKLEEQLTEYAAKLTGEVAKKTAQLESRVRQLEKINKAMLEREVKLIELQKEIAELKDQIKRDILENKK